MFHEYPEAGVLHFSSWVFNCYVIQVGDSGAPVVVDAGLPSTATEVARHLARGASSDPLTIAATHGHSDHLGGVSTLASLAPVQLHMPERDRRYLAGETPRTPNLKAISRIIPVLLDARFSVSAFSQAAKAGKTVGFGSKHPYSLPLAPSGYLDEGDHLPGAPEWTVLSTPGHTDDSISFYNATTKTLLSGDAVVTHKGLAWFTPEYCDEALMAETEERLRTLEVRHLFPGHGHAITGRDLLARARSHLDGPRSPARG